MKLKQLQTVEDFIKFLYKEEKPEEILKYLEYRLKAIHHDYVIPMDVFASDSDDSDYVTETSEEEEEVDTSNMTDEEISVEHVKDNEGRLIEIKLRL
jgi:hypothetical protein